MNLMNRMMSYDKTKINQENCNCKKCVSAENVDLKNQIVEYPKLSEEEIEQIINERYFNKDDKTKTFIRKALRKHGNRYDYSNVIYVKAKIDVEIICRVEGHKPFPQKPSNHLSGKGCKLCGNIKCHEKLKLTLEEFIEKSNMIHDKGRYDYSKVIYVNNDTEVIIICPNHDEPYEFPQKPRSHLNGSGCPICYGTQKLDLKEFVERANKIHGKGTYDYSKVIYTNYKTEVIITCSKHGDFPQTPSNHFKGAGCPDCWEEKKATLYNLTLEEFIERANEVHGIGTYDYSKVNYINMYTDVIITCPKHGDFPQQPNNHVSGEGCPKCNNYKGEIAIRKFLTECKIEFEEQKKFNDCKDERQLPFDFYIPLYNLCIEFDGEGHFKPIKRSKEMTDEQAKEKLNYVQRHDEIKTNYCKNNGINLLRLKNYKTIEKELKKYFQINL